ncbi:MAG: hypothetical protein M1828_006523 [Chrysothrix sp. TS-e1954]|nr:MAG: hypothetical protein M1828_006523 [Chrysothrix sp. TS-e1954]
MTTTFTALPIIDLSPLSNPNPTPSSLHQLSTDLHTAFKDVGFVYLTNAPISFSHDQIFSIASRFFSSPASAKMSLAKKMFVPTHRNTYRGYFPAQSGSDNLKEGFEIGPTPAPPSSTTDANSSINLTEPNVFPNSPDGRTMAQTTARLHAELQSLSMTLLTLLASSLGKLPTAFTSLLTDSISTLRLLHYPAPPHPLSSSTSTSTSPLTCTPHTDSGLLTLLHQDLTGGLEVLNAAGDWIQAPTVPGAIVVNLGDLLARLSGGVFVATMHRVRSFGVERYSVPFFCEPGGDAMVPGGEGGEEVRYARFLRGKMGGWVEFREEEEGEVGVGRDVGAGEVEVGA